MIAVSFVHGCGAEVTLDIEDIESVRIGPVDSELFNHSFIHSKSNNWWEVPREVAMKIKSLKFQEVTIIETKDN